MHNFDDIHATNVARYEKAVLKAYRETIDSIIKLSYRLSLNANNEFYFRNNSVVSNKVNELLKELYNNVYGITVEGINEEWDVAVKKNDSIAKAIYGKDLKDLPAEVRASYLSNNDAARRAFVYKKDASGLGLSDKIWKNTRQLKTELELALEVGIGKGKSAASLSRDVRQYLNEPDKLFRKVRSNQKAINDKLAELKLLKDNDASLSSIRSVESDIAKLRNKGALRLSNAAKSYHPGAGRYRSSYKNSLRLTRNETNFSYEGSQLEKRSQQDFIVAIEIKVSPGHQASDDKGGISCLSLQGKYPKNFDFTNKWHVNCKCQSFNVLKSDAELDADLDSLLAGGNPSNSADSKNAVNKTPKNYTDYKKENDKQWSKWANYPRTFDRN